MEKPDFYEWVELKHGIDRELLENSSRYSVEVNYRSDMGEVLEGFVKLMLSYTSAGMKNCGYHVKNLITEKPFRILVSTRNWDDGEWVGVALFNDKVNKFVIAGGFYNKDRKTVSIQEHKPTDAQSAAALCKELRNYMERLKKRSPRDSQTLQPAKLKRGPKPTHLKLIDQKSGPTV